MALRRPRVKACANLSSKRKVKKECDNNESIEPKIEIVSENIPESKVTHSSEKETAADSPKVPNTPTDNNFKFPFSIDKKEKIITSNQIGSDLEQISDVSHLHEQHSIMSNSPVKPRQRIRPMPYFGARRNSVQGSGLDSEDESRRHKLNATSVHNPLNTDSKMHLSSTNRKRTESTCSNVSENNSSRDIVRPRKMFATEESQRISVAKKEFQSKYSGKPPEKSLLKMFDFIYYNPTSNPMKQGQKKDSNGEESIISLEEKQDNHIESKSDEPEKVEPQIAIEEKQDDVAPNMPVPQLKLGPNGELVLDEASLVIETTAEKEARAKLATSSVIYVDENTQNNGFYKRQRRSKDWNAEETIKFYRCLHTVGTDFSLMLTLFPNRKRRDLKLKFKREERHNLALINKALLYPKTFDIDELKRELELDERVAEQKQKKWEEIQKKSQKSKKIYKVAPRNKISKSARALNDGDIAYENENIVRVTKKSLAMETESDENNVINQEMIEQNLIDALLDTENCDIPYSGNEDSLINLSDNQEEEHFNNSQIVESKFFSNVNNVLREIANGSLVIVSSEDPNNSEKTVDEIYVICKETGELSDEPLELPDDVMECILSAING